MKIKQLLITVGFLVGTTALSFSQNSENDGSKGELKEYDRSSIATMMVFHPEDEFAKDIHTAFYNVPMPDKYNDHNFVKNRNINNTSVKRIPNKKSYEKYMRDSVRICSDDPGGYGWKKYKRRHNKPVVNSLVKHYGTLKDDEISQNAEAIERYLNEKNFGRMMVSKWFNLHYDPVTKTSTFDVSLIQERGQYNATEMDVAIAEHSARGMAMLSDAGEDLIKNTFILVNDITYVTVEEQQQIAQGVMSVLGSLLDAYTGGSYGRDISNTYKAISDNYTGFKVKTNSYLFQLQWNDSVAAVFYKNYYTTSDLEKINRYFADDSTFKVKYVAHEYEYSKKSAVKGQYDRGEFIKIICARSMDKNIAALQKSYEDFKVKTPVYEVIGEEKSARYAAQIGLKEGIDEKSKFQVVQRVIDPKTNRTKYKYVATVIPESGKIWDNRYAAATEDPNAADLKYTTFKKVSGGEILPGMLMIEGKYRKITK